MIEMITEALKRITHLRFFETERGYQGELAGLLSALVRNGVWPGDGIVEEEYQKRARDHGIRKRPDIIIHRPAQRGENRRAGNYLVLLLKRKGTRADATEDFNSLNEIITALDYPLGVFLNIDSSQTYSHAYEGPFRDRLHFIAVSRHPGQIIITHDHFEGEDLRTVVIPCVPS